MAKGDEGSTAAASVLQSRMPLAAAEPNCRVSEEVMSAFYASVNSTRARLPYSSQKLMATILTIDITTLNLLLRDYDAKIFAELEPVLVQMRLKSNALAANLQRCFTKFRDTDRYLRAYQGEILSSSEKELTQDEFMVFREYVRLLRSCTIMCGKEVSGQYKKLFMDFFAGRRLDLARELGGHEASSKQKN